MKLEATAVEEWAKEFERAEKRQLTQEETLMCMNALFGEDELNKDEEVLELLVGKRHTSMATVVYKRVNFHHTYTITPTVALLSEIVAKSFGNSTMLCAYLQYKAHQLGIKTINAEVFCRYIFPWGVPTDNELQRLWDLQKLDPELLKKRKSFEPDNGLDYKVPYESIMKIGNEE